MAKTNILRNFPFRRTHEGAAGAPLSPEQELRRTVLACLLWEDTFYEDGVSIAERIEALVAEVDPEIVAEMAIDARVRAKLRHAPLLIAVALARRHALKARTLEVIIQRADELGEFLSLYWKDGRVPIAAQVKKGLAAAFTKFDEYQLARYAEGGAVKLRDVLFLVRPKPRDEAQAALWARLANKELATPDTWEVAISSGADKKATFERLLGEGRLGYLALLRNLRNMHRAEVDVSLVEQELMRGAGRDRVLPFRFVAAARTTPEWEPLIEKAMLASLEGAPRLKGRTVLLVDVSGSMHAPLSARSDLTRLETASALAMLCREICDDVALYTFSNETRSVPARRGFAVADAIRDSQPHGGTALGAAVTEVGKREREADRLIIFTDEQSQDEVGAPPIRPGYMVNVASYENGVGYGDWTRVTGFSEAVLEFIRLSEVEAG